MRLHRHSTLSSHYFSAAAASRENEFNTAVVECDLSSYG